jgi:hypothetical protein
LGLWQGTALNTNALAKLFNHVHTNRSVGMVIKATPLLNSMMGRPGDDGKSAYNKNVGGWGKSKVITGEKYEVSLLGALMTPATVADGSAELTAATIAYNSARHGAAEFPLSHWALTPGIPSSEYNRIRGDDAKTISWAGEFYDEVVASYDDVIAADLHEDSTSKPPARDQFGSWITAIDDGNTYGTIDRSDSANADYKGVVSTTTGTLTIPKIQEYINRARMNRGKIRVGVMGITLYNAWQQLIQPYSQATYNKDMAMFGSENVQFMGVDWVLDPDCPSTKIGGFDPSTWVVVTNKYPFTDGGIVKEPTLVAGYIMPTELWAQNICIKPNSNVKWEDVTA